jgi:hypothetical protein
MSKRHYMTDKDMTLMYRGFNEVFFDNRLPRYVKVRFVPEQMLRNVNKHHEADAAWRPALGEIWIDQVYARSESIALILLLHEMAHVKLEGTYFGHPSKNPGHGMIFQAEIFRLIMAGAYDGLL